MLSIILTVLSIIPNIRLKSLEAATKAGVACLVLCDTNGGALPDDITKAVKAAAKVTSVSAGYSLPQ